MPVSTEDFKMAFGLTDTANQSRENAIETINRHLKIVQDLAHTDELDELLRVVGSCEALIVRLAEMDDKHVRSHLQMLSKELPPIKRLIASLEPKKDAPVDIDSDTDDVVEPRTVTETTVSVDAVEDEGTLPPARQGVRKAITEGDLAEKLLDPGFKGEVQAWMEKISDPDAGQKKELIAVFRAMPESEAKVRETAFMAAFNCTLAVKDYFDPSGPDKQLPPKALTKVLDTIETLPKEHLPKGWNFRLVEDMSTSGGAWDTDNETAEITLGLDDVPNFNEPNAYPAPGDALEGTKYFESVIHHELGHAVDTRNNGKELTDSPAGGKWEHHGMGPQDVFDVVPSALSGFAGAVKSALKLKTSLDGSDVKKWFLAVRITEIQDAQKLKAALTSSILTYTKTQDIGILEGVSGNMAQKKAIAAALPMNHEFIKMLEQAFRLNPSLAIGSNPIANGGRVYLYDESNGWYSFDRASWNNKVSLYQYAAPGEWFAEFYVAANNPKESIRKKAESAFSGAYQWLKKKGLLIYG